MCADIDVYKGLIMDEVKFKNTSRMNGEEVGIFQGYAMKKTICLMSIFFTLIFGGIGVGLAFWDLTAGIICVACGLVGGVFLLPYLIKENQKKVTMQALGDRKYLNAFSFYDDCFITICEATQNLASNDYQEMGSQKIDYSSIFKTVIYKDRLFIFIDPQQSFILNFDGMTVGTIADLVEFLKSKDIKIVDNSSIDTKPKQKR